MKIDKFHWHEALYTAYLAQMFIQSGLIDHATWGVATPEMKDHIDKALSHLYSYYNICEEQSDKLEDQS